MNAVVQPQEFSCVKIVISESRLEENGFAEAGSMLVRDILEPLRAEARRISKAQVEILPTID